MFPTEIFERILYYADGRTLFQAYLVSDQWKYIVEYLEREHNIWKRCCKSDIPSHILYSIEDKCCYDDLKNKWKKLYQSYYSLQCIKNKKYLVLPKQNSDYFEKNISCSKISGSRIVYGNNAGIICVLNEIYEVEDVTMTDIAENLKDIVFINEIESSANSAYKHTHAIAFYEKRFIILELEPKITEIEEYSYARHACIYKDVIAYVSSGSKVTVSKISINESDPEASILQEMKHYQCHGTSIVQSLCIYDRFVTVLTDNEILTLEYQKDNIIRHTQTIPFPYKLLERFWLFYNQILFSTTSSHLYFSTIGQKSTVIRRFNCMENLESPISEILLYGNILIIGCLSGNVFIYVVDDWSEFELSNYDLKIYIYGEPICHIDVQELEDEHRLLLTMSDYIGQVFIHHFS